MSDAGLNPYSSTDDPNSQLYSDIFTFVRLVGPTTDNSIISSAVGLTRSIAFSLPPDNYYKVPFAAVSNSGPAFAQTALDTPISASTRRTDTGVWLYQEIPEPSSLLLLGAGLLSFAAVRRARKHA